MNIEFGDKSEGKDPVSFWGKGFIIDSVQSIFDCPVCTCENDISAKLDNIKNPTFKIRCNGCKRPLQAYSDPLTGKLTVTEIIVK